MIREVTSSEYIDSVYGSGMNIALLHCRDEAGLWRRAIESLRGVDHQFHDSRNVHLWVCHVVTAEDASVVQAVKLPQIRFFWDGSEEHSHTGVMSSEEITNKIFSLEGQRWEKRS